MNELFTILIILAAIISFLNKMFGNKKRQQRSREQKPPIKPGPMEWMPPWSEESEDYQSSSKFDSDFEEIEVEENDESQSRPYEIVPEQQSPTATPYRDRAVKPVLPTVAASGTPKKRLEELNIELSSPDDLKRGIILAEILGPCKAKRKLSKYGEIR